MATSAALGVAASVPFYKTQNWLMAALVLAVALWGARAPDALEMYKWSDGKRRSIIPHRTITHWPPVWILIALPAYFYTPTEYQPLIVVGLLACLLHLLMDFLTPSGIPLFNPFGKSYRFILYRTGSLKGEALATLVTWVAAGAIAPILYFSF